MAWRLGGVKAIGDPAGVGKWCEEKESLSGKQLQ